MIKKTVRFLCALLLSLQSAQSIALEDPVQMLQQVTQTVMTKINADASHLKKHPNELYAIVDTTVFPHVDFVEMARWVVGRNAWRDASESVRQSFIKEFKTLVVRSYAHSLLEYVDYTFEFLPLRTDPQTQKRLEVLSKAKGDGRILNMEYRLVRDNDAWKVYDIIFESVSLIQGYRAQFAEDIQRNGVEAVVETLHKKNERAHHASEPVKQDA
ncbi:MAG: ABC transporter substrate-binding protein [Gammaproteobacteria bacterium]|nr:ABC transporter substrate-binding protein [Gammaproteobacteria bacterium]